MPVPVKRTGRCEPVRMSSRAEPVVGVWATGVSLPRMGVTVVRPMVAVDSTAVGAMVMLSSSADWVVTASYTDWYGESEGWSEIHWPACCCATSGSRLSWLCMMTASPWK